jgi:polysaccharide biosynthesis protein PslJ
MPSAQMLAPQSEHETTTSKFSEGPADPLAVVALPNVTTGGDHTSPRPLPYGWPLRALVLAFPLWWALGLAGFVWAIFAVPMLFRLFRGKVRAPRGFGIWLLFVFWTGVSVIGVEGGGASIAFAYRLLMYLSATVMFLYVYNAPRRQLSTRKVVTTLATFWLIVVLGGWLGVLVPLGEFTSPVEMIIPSSLAQDGFVHQLIHPAFAQVMDFLGYPVGRPKAPFPYTNDWGSNFGLLLPFFLLAMWGARRAGRILAARLILAASIITVFVSLNRGLWLSVGASLIYAAVRLASRGRTTALRSVAVLACAIALLFAFTPLKGVVSDRVSTPHSNEGRTRLYTEAIHLAIASPLVGYGSPQEVSGDHILPPVGTQGQFWLVLVSQGIVGAALFMGFFGYVAWRTGKGSGVMFWCHVAIVTGLIQTLFYDMIPAQLHVLMIVSALGLREMEEAS